MNILDELSNHLQAGDSKKVAELTKQAIDEGLDPRSILDGGLVAGMSVIGEKFKAHEIFLPDVLLAAKSMYAGMSLLKPLMIRDELPSLGKVIVGTVQGDLHDIGKNLVAIMLRGAGFDVIDLGSDVSPERFLDSAQREGAAVVGMSALLTTTMPVMKIVIEMAKERQLYGKIKFIVGGAPLSHEYAASIGADAYCYDGVNAVDSVRSLLGVG